MLRISGLTKRYRGGVTALDGVSLNVERGVFGLLGPNGAGKSTLMRTLAALQEPDAGSITLDGIDALVRPHELRRRLGYLPQEFGVYPGVPARELLDHLAVLKGIAGRAARREQVDALLELTNLQHVRNRAVSTFSGGMKQRFGIAQALLGDPRLVIVDEPTAGLDPEERNRFYNLLSEIGERAIVLLSTHIVDDVRELCPRMAVLSRGRIAAAGAPSDLVAGMKGRLWRRTVTRSEAVQWRQTHHVLSSHLFAGETRLHVLAEEFPGEGFEAIEPDLEDVYFSVLLSAGDRAEAAA